MKTTIDIPDALAARARTIASERETTLRALVVAGLRSELDRMSAATPIDFSFPTVRGEGLAIEVDPAQAIALSYEPLDLADATEATRADA